MPLAVEHLEDIARAKDSERRRELLVSISDLFLAGDSGKSERERALYTDIFLRTVDELDTDGRREVAEQLADSAETPRSVAKRLACDDLTVADPILRLSPVLLDDDLVEIAQSMPNGHLVSISQRQALSETVTDVLIDRGDANVMRSVAANDGARISANGFHTLAAKAGEDEVLQQNLSGRLDVPEEVMRRVLPRVSGDVAQRVRQAFAKAVDKSAMGKAMVEAEKAFAGAKLDASRARVAALVTAKEVAEGKRELADVVRSLAAEEKFIELVTVLGRLVDLPEGMVGNMMYKTENAPSVIICRSAGLDRSSFTMFSELRCRRLKLPSSHGNHAVAEFDAISPELAKRFLRFVNLRMSI